MDTVKMNPPMPDQNNCPQCGTPLPFGALAGLCPACLLKMGAAADTVTDAKQKAFVPPEVAELAAKFPQLEILELIGKGGMGAVYKARQKQLDRIVALKILPPGIGDEPAFAERFAREAKALAKLNHPNIVTLYEFGNASGQFYFLMEFVDGVNLRQLLAGNRMAPREALAIVPQICDALQFAHDQGIVHRDIKPENILLDRRGRVKVADFGLAKIVRNDGSADLPVSQGEAAAQQHHPTSDLTDAGKVMGTPQYMSPEQIQAPGEVDHRADIYALGVVFYQMLTGELPGKKLEAPSKKVSIDVRLDEIVLRALEKKPELRYQQVSDVKTLVESLTNVTALGSTAAAPPPAWLGFEYKSARTWFGLPLLHVAQGVDLQTGKARHARGIIAVGGTATGVVALGGRAYGGFAFGGIAVGVFAFGGLAAGLVSFGGLAVALCLALGGLTIAPIAIGGLAVGYWAIGGQAYGVSVFDSTHHSADQLRLLRGPGLNWFTASFWILWGVCMAASFLIPIWAKRKVKAVSAPDASGAAPADCTRAMAQWLALMDQGDYAQSWATAAPYFQRAMAKDEWVKRLTEIRHPLGHVLSRQLTAGKYTNGGLWYEARYATSFDGLLTATETVTIARQASGEWLAVGYLIRPAAVQQARDRFNKLWQFLLPVAVVLAVWLIPLPKQWLSHSRPHSAAPELTFGPVVERVVADSSASFANEAERTNALIMVDFDSGKLFAGSSTMWAAGKDAEYLWMRNNGVDAMGFIHSFHGLVGLDMKVSTVPAVTWDTEPDTLALDQFKNVQPQETAVMDAETNPSKTWFFQTREGSMGILQITGFTENPRGVKIRYKLAQNGNEPKRVAMLAVQNWLALADAGAYSQTWDTAAASFRADGQKDAWVKLLEKVRQPLGSVLSRKVISTQTSSALPGMPAGSYFIAQFETAFAAEPHAVETVTFALEKDGQWRAIAYLIRPRNAEQTAAVKAAEKWLVGIDAGNYAGSWNDASDYFQSAITQDKWVEALQSVRKPLGELKIRAVDSAVTETQLPGTPDGKYVVMQFETAFANKNSATETVTFSLEADGAWKACGYYIK